MQKSLISQKVLTLLSNHLGVEAEDITPDDSFVDDLHMSKVDLADFAHTLTDANLEISPEDINNYDTVEDLIDILVQETAV